MTQLNKWPEVDMVVSDFERSVLSIANISDAVLRTELLRRSEIRNSDNDKATCGSKERGAYNTPIHVMALFLLLLLSILACSFPVLARRFPRLPIPRHFLFISRHFGTGVLIATAFVHLLPTAFASLTDPCLPQFWSKTYRAMAGFLAMASVFVVVVVEMFFAMKGAGHVHGSGYDHLISSDRRECGDYAGGEAPYPSSDQQGSADSIRLVVTQEGSRANLIQQGSRLSSGDSTDEHNRMHLKDLDPHKEDSDMDLEEFNSYRESLDEQHNNYPRARGHQLHHPDKASQQKNDELSIQNPQRQLVQCLLLEASILFHSIFIGMALSVATGTSFMVLLVAVCFHQTFEGFALGSRIASLIPELFSPLSPKPWLMALAYGTTTPIGQAIGLVLHNLYDPANTTGLLMVGITNAISGGLSLFAGLVELLAEDFLSESSYTTLRGRRRIEAYAAVVSGALLMAFVGAFA